MVQPPARLYTAPLTGLAIAFAGITLVTVVWFWLAARKAAPQVAGVLRARLLA